jgi:hypothetical protein
VTLLKGTALRPSITISITVALATEGSPIALAYLDVFRPNPSQIRHPERSAARIYRITDGLCAKSKSLS